MGVRTLVGAIGGQVVTEQTAAMYIGAETCSNNTAELSAVVVPLWLLLGILTHQPLHVWPDSKYTIDMVEGRCRPIMHCKLIQNARQIVNMHRSRHGLRFTHVPTLTTLRTSLLTVLLTWRGGVSPSMCSLISFLWHHLFFVTFHWSIGVPCLRLLSMPMMMLVLCLSGTQLSLIQLTPSFGSDLSSQCPMRRGSPV